MDKCRITTRGRGPASPRANFENKLQTRMSFQHVPLKHNFICHVDPFRKSELILPRARPQVGANFAAARNFEISIYTYTQADISER